MNAFIPILIPTTELNSKKILEVKSCPIHIYVQIICDSYIRILILIICSFSAIFNDSCLCFWWNGLIYHAHIKTTITHLRDGQHTISGT